MVKNYIKSMKFFFIIVNIFFSFSVYANDDLIGKKILCSKLLWGFEFFSSEKVNVISTNINKITNVQEYYYETDLELSYINLYLNQKDKENATFSIHRDTLRVDVWTMTSGGNTTREIIPKGFCKLAEIKNIINYIEDLKNIR